MLGYVLGITLVLTLFSPLIFTDIFADSFIVNFDKELYVVGDSLTVSGEITEIGMPIIAMSVYDPDGKILAAHNLDISSEKKFSKTLSLDSPFYEKAGQYLIKFDYGKISENHYFIIDGLSFETEIFNETFEEPEIILLYTEQKQYSDQDIIQVSGLVSALDSPSVLIGIYDPFGMPAGFYFGTINSNLEFTTSFLAKDGVNFRVDGTYTIKAHYAETEATSFFEYSEIPSVIIKDTIVKDTIVKDTIVKDTIVKDTIVKDTIVENVDFEIKKQNNLTVEDVELGKLLNQINLKCDSSTFVDIISYYDGMGPALYRLCEFDSSLNFFNEALADNPNDVEILVNKGSTLGKLGYFSEAIVYYDYSITIDPNFLPAKNNKANALANLGNFDDAILLYNEVLTKNPDYLTTQKNLNVALSLTSSLSDESSEPLIENLSHSTFTLSEKIDIENSEKQNFDSFFDEVGIAFSTLSSLFSFLN